MAEAKFIKQDFKIALKKKNVSLHIVSSYSGPIYPDKANDIINAWCYSANYIDKYVKIND